MVKPISQAAPSTEGCIEDLIYDKKAEKNRKSVGFGGFTSAADDGKDHINWVHTILLLGSPVLAAYGLYHWDFNMKTFILAVLWYSFGAVGITAGYHRLWSHKAFSARLPLQIMLNLFGTIAMEGSIRWWCRNHRAHHRYTDTPRDPYDVNRSFWWAHMGWMLHKQNKKKVGRATIHDLNLDPLVNFQHKYYGVMAPFLSWILPTLIAAQWGDAFGGFFIAGMARMVCCHNATFCINSLAHYFGDTPFSDLQTARDSFLCAIITFGEGFHNFHHSFPADYRNGTQWFEYDPTKWLIFLWSKVGLAYDLRRIPDSEILKSRLQVQQRKVDRSRLAVSEVLSQRPDFHGELPSMSWDDIEREVAEEGAALVVIKGVVYDLAEFVDQHPGGRLTLLRYLGTDATAQYTGEEADTQVESIKHVHGDFADGFLKLMAVANLEV